jgi:hypothetical protein
MYQKDVVNVSTGDYGNVAGIEPSYCEYQRVTTLAFEHNTSEHSSETELLFHKPILPLNASTGDYGNIAGIEPLRVDILVSGNADVSDRGNYASTTRNSGANHRT